MWPEETGKLFDAVGSEAKEPPLRREVDAVQVEDHVDRSANTKRVVIPKKRRQHDVIQAFLKDLQSKCRPSASHPGTESSPRGHSIDASWTDRTARRPSQFKSGDPTLV